MKAVEAKTITKRRAAGQWAVAWRRFKKNKAALAGLFIVGFYVFLAIAAPLIATYPPRSYQPLYEGENAAPPSWKHPFGTTLPGNDILSESIHATRNDLYVGLAATALSVAIGIAIGAIAGYAKGATSSGLLGLTQIFLVFPALILILLLSRVLILLVAQGLGLTIIVLVLGIFGWPPVAFLVRGEVLKLKEMEFVQAVRALGATSRRVIFRHLVPNLLSPVIVYASLLVAFNILTEVGISFLGFGDANTVTWGLLLEQGRLTISTQWWVAIFPGLMVVFIVLGFNLIGDGLSDALNPRLRE